MNSEIFLHVRFPPHLRARARAKRCEEFGHGGFKSFSKYNCFSKLLLNREVRGVPRDVGRLAHAICEGGSYTKPGFSTLLMGCDVTG